MNIESQPIQNQPALSIVDGSGQDSVRFFDTFAIEQPERLQTILSSDDVILETPHFAPETEDATHEEAIISLRGLLAHARNGKLIDYDGDTWAALMQDQQYTEAASTMRSLRGRDDGLEDQRRRVAVKGLSIYAVRVARYHDQEATVVAFEPPADSNRQEPFGTTDQLGASGVA